MKPFPIFLLLLISISLPAYAVDHSQMLDIMIAEQQKRIDQDQRIKELSEYVLELEKRIRRLEATKQIKAK